LIRQTIPSDRPSRQKPVRGGNLGRERLNGKNLSCSKKPKNANAFEEHFDVLIGRPAAARSKALLKTDRPYRVYLRAAQAYMLISMPTGTSTIFGVFQTIGAS
jgi:hypothetical protein